MHKHTDNTTYYGKQKRKITLNLKNFGNVLIGNKRHKAVFFEQWERG